MRVDVLLFAVARQRAGRDAIALELPPGATVAGLRAALASGSPELASIVPGLMIALDGRYARDDEPIPEGAEVAAIPPVSGGSPVDPTAQGDVRWSS